MTLILIKLAVSGRKSGTITRDQKHIRFICTCGSGSDMKPWRTGVCRVTGDVTQKSLCGRVSPQRIVHTTNVTYGHAHVTQRSKSLSSDMYNSSKQIKQEVVQRSLCRAQEDTNLGTTLPNTNTCVRFQLEDPTTILSLFPKLTSCWRPGLYGTGKSTSEILRGKPKQNTLMISWSESHFDMKVSAYSFITKFSQ